MRGAVEAACGLVVCQSSYMNCDASGRTRDDYWSWMVERAKRIDSSFGGGDMAHATG